MAALYDDYECATCRRVFSSRRAMHQHMDVRNHWPIECSRCDETFTNEEDCQEHEYINHHYCRNCDCSFADYNKLHMHLNSSRHRGRSVACPLCHRDFTSATDLVNHLKSNACPDAVANGDTMNRFKRSKDSNELIDKTLLKCRISPPYEALELSWNGDTYECPLCRREFSSLHGLNRHLSSAFHQQSLHHCPNCNCPNRNRRDFEPLGSIINHLEPGTFGVAPASRPCRAVSISWLEMSGY